MRWTVEFAEDARREFLSLPEAERSQIAKRISLLERNAFPVGCVKLGGSKNLYRVRVGRYRVLYYAYHHEHRIVITRVRHRKDAYR